MARLPGHDVDGDADRGAATTTAASATRRRRGRARPTASTTPCGDMSAAGTRDRRGTASRDRYGSWPNARSAAVPGSLRDHLAPRTVTDGPARARATAGTASSPPARAARGRWSTAPRSRSTRARRIAILALLAIEGRPCARDELAALLWPDSDDERRAARCAGPCPCSAPRSGTRWLASTGLVVAARRGAAAPRPRELVERPAAIVGPARASGAAADARARPVPRRLRPARQHRVRRLARDADLRASARSRSSSTASPTRRPPATWPPAIADARRPPRPRPAR